MTDHARLRALAGITEAPEVMDNDDVLDNDLAEMDARSAREKRIVAIIQQVLDRIGFPYDKFDGLGVSYDERPDRTATIATNDTVDLSYLVALHGSGLAKTYKVSPGKFELTIEFEVDQSFDGNVTMTEANGTKRFWKAL
jgi:hypothetical protein